MQPTTDAHRPYQDRGISPIGPRQSAFFDDARKIGHLLIFARNPVLSNCLRVEHSFTMVSG
jgi:hypothetical protein